MKEKILTRRYADAYMKMARESLGNDKAVEEFKDFRRVIYDNPDMLKFFRNPEMSYHEKCALLYEVAKDRFSADLIIFIKFLMEKERIALIEDIAEYIRVNYSPKGALKAVIKTTYPLDLSVIKQIKERLEKRFHKTLNLYIELEPELLGGIKIIVKNTIIDGSVRKRLEEIKGNLQKVKVV